MRTIAIFALLALNGCGYSAMKNISNNYNRSLDAYKECVQARGVDGCRSEKAILDADAQRYQSAWAAVNGGPDTSASRPAIYQPVGGGTYVRY